MCIRIKNESNISSLGTSSSKKVVKRLMSTQADLYWWNPLLDDPKMKNSVSKKIYKICTHRINNVNLWCVNWISPGFLS